MNLSQLPKNVGKKDTKIRYAVGIALVAWGIATHHWLGAIGLIAIVTAYLGSCPAYMYLGVDTSKDGK